MRNPRCDRTGPPVHRRGECTRDVFRDAIGIVDAFHALGHPARGRPEEASVVDLLERFAITLVGFDFCCGEEDAIKSGTEDASVAQFPSKMAELGVEALVKAIRGEKVESLIDSGAALVTQENMAEFM